MISGAEPTIHGDGEQSHNFTFVPNVVEANLLACRASGAAWLVYKIGTGDRYTLNHTLQLIGKISGMPASAKHGLPRKADIRDSQADIAQARQIIGYNPGVDFEEGLKQPWDWYYSSRI